MINRVTNSSPGSDSQRFQYLIAGISDYAIYMLDPDGYITSWNAGAQRFKGYTEVEIIGEHFSRFYTQEDRASGLPARALGIALSEGKYESEGWRVRKDGTRFWAHVVIDPIYDNEGRMLGYAKVTRDVTDRKHAEDALRESEQRFRLLVQGVTDYAIFMLSPQGIVTNWNIGAQRIKGYTEEEIVGSHFSRFYTEEDRAQGLPALALDTASKVGRWEREGWRVRKDGTRFWAHVVIDAIYDETGELLGFAKITRDLTEKKAASDALAEVNAALFQAQKMESIGQLTGGIAHDFNNLLSVLASGLEVLNMQRASNADARTFDSMRRAIDRGATLTQQLLAFARQQPLQPELHNVNRLITGFESVLRRAGNASIEFDIALAPSLPSTVLDRARFESALLNLVVNARDAMPEGGKLLIRTNAVSLKQQEVSGLAAGDYVKVSVCDSGSGMSPETIRRAFEPFFTTKEVGKGTGLGLSQVYGFIKQSGGEVVIKSELGKGTEISIYLPAVHGSDEVDEDKTETVLIVEDESDLMDMATSLFLNMGYNVLTAPSGNEALAVLRARPVDILFTDIVMPEGIDGIELAQFTRKNYPETKIVVASGFPLPTLRERHADINDFSFVNKPYRLSDLARVLRTAS
ncbi:PAS domain-containing sensor histidine kinase [Massilia terrae]|uniref:histidine kinase n=1 Tax=Massilia terrae TaxID=1811224 RepID=A0ABT2CRA8_9BURK|nr:PAS domain-containing sensor histidine kinase [Massilia terrae]MCS0656493.1 PAS domain S-box protein [Massilia terrae]